MKRGLVILALAIAAVVGTAVVVHQRSLPRATPMGWLYTEFGLDEAQARRAEVLHAAYETQCREMCAKIAASDARLVKLIHTSKEVTPEIRAAIAETDRYRTECRANMLEHFYLIASEMPPAKREKYLSLMLPTVLHPADMERSHQPR